MDSNILLKGNFYSQLRLRCLSLASAVPSVVRKLIFCFCATSICTSFSERKEVSDGYYSLKRLEQAASWACFRCLILCCVTPFCVCTD